MQIMNNAKKSMNECFSCLATHHPTRTEIQKENRHAPTEFWNPQGPGCTMGWILEALTPSKCELLWGHVAKTTPTFSNAMLLVYFQGKFMSWSGSGIAFSLETQRHSRISPFSQFSKKQTSTLNHKTSLEKQLQISSRPVSKLKKKIQFPYYS